MATFQGFAQPSAAAEDEASSPQMIGGALTLAQQQQQQQQQRRQRPLPPSLQPGSSELARLTAQYQSEAERLAQQLDLCGVPLECLSSKGRRAVQLLAEVAGALQLSEARPELVLAAWASVVVKQSRADALQHQLRREAEALARKHAAAQAKLRSLQGVLSEVQAQQKRWGAVVAEEAKLGAAMREKSSEYQRQQARHQRKLAANGFTPEITHAALIERHGRVAELQAQLAELKGRLDGYHHLPPSVLGAQMMLQNATERLQEKQERLQSRLADMH